MLIHVARNYIVRCAFAPAMLGALSFILMSTSVNAQIETDSTNFQKQTDEFGYKTRQEGESEFDNRSDSYILDYKFADPEYEDTEFGELMYNEASTPTKLEILRLLSKETPSTMVMMNAIAMGLDIDDVLRAAIKFQPEKKQELAGSAVSLLPILPDAPSYQYSSYELEDLEREDETLPYSVERVAEKFFKQRLILSPSPDWYDGQYHFLASAKELLRLQEPQKNIRWYHTKSTETVTKRPIFVSLYESTGSVLIDGEERIKEALKNDPDVLMPVVFIFNRLKERAIDELEDYPLTIRGIQKGFAEKSLILTPTPEWQLGDYHIYAGMDEFYEVFEIPEEQDFEPEAWQKLLEEAEDYSVTNNSFLLVAIGSGEDEDGLVLTMTDKQLYAQWDNPRSESAFPYTPAANSGRATLKSLVGKGMVFNRPDLIAALNALGVDKVPVSFYYIDDTRVRPFLNGARGFNNIVNCADGPSDPPFGGGFGEPPVCASPPCQMAPQ